MSKIWLFVMKHRHAMFLGACIAFLGGCASHPPVMNRSLHFEKDSQYRFLFASQEVPRRVSTEEVIDERQKQRNNRLKGQPWKHSGVKAKATGVKARSESNESAMRNDSVALASNPKSQDIYFYDGRPRNSIHKNKLCISRACFSLAKPIDPQRFKYKELTISLIDSEPVWRASDEYFLVRGLPLPETHSKFRYLKAPFKAPIIYTEEGLIIANSDLPIEDDSILLVKTPLPEILDLERGEKIFLLD